MKTSNTHRRIAAVIAAVGLAGLGGGVASAGADTTVPDDTGAEGTEAAGTDAGSDVETTCETALDEDDSVESLAELDFSELSLNVGSKDFVEQFVLGQMLIVGLEAGGAEVTDSTNLGGTVVNRDAMLAGEIDMYFDYNGTGYTVFLEQEDPSFEREVLTDAVCNLDLEENDVRWLGVSEFNNTYGFATGPDFLNEDGEPFDLQGMADYVAENSDAVVCLETEFPNRPDGLVLFEEATGVVIPPDQIETLETGVIYDETASGNCDFGEIFTTDGRIPALDLNLVEDPGVFILYNVSLTMLDSVYQQAPEAFEALADTILTPLDNDTMAELNRRVSADGEEPRTVAEDYLREQGLIE